MQDVPSLQRQSAQKDMQMVTVPGCFAVLGSRRHHPYRHPPLLAQIRQRIKEIQFPFKHLCAHVEPGVDQDMAVAQPPKVWADDPSLSQKLHGTRALSNVTLRSRNREQ